MESYMVGKADVQGRYTNAASAGPVAPAAPKPEKKSFYPLNNVSKPSTNNAVAFPAEVVASKTDSQGSKTANLSDEQKAKYEEIAKDGSKMDALTEILNDFMAQFNADLKFSLHKETSMLTVKFVDMKNNKVLKEFPPEEYLDMIANIRKSIGAMIDEKA